MKNLLLAATMLFAPLPAFAQDAALPDADPAMWVVKDDDTTIYLFGTFHLLDGKRDWFNDEVKTAFDASDELVLEAILPENPAELQPMIMRYAVDPEGTTLSSRLTDEQKAKLAAALSSVGAPPTAIDQFEPWFASFFLAQIAMQKMGISGDHGPEKILTEAAKARTLPIAELESVEKQLVMLDSMSPELQLKQLGVTLEEFDQIAAELAPMLEAWSNGNTDELVEIMNEQLTEYPELYHSLFTERNEKWAAWLASRLEQPGTVFVAVGAGHLAGEDSVQQMLAKRGIETARIAAE